MRFLVDAQLPPALAKWLNERGYFARSVRDAGLRDESDAAIWAYAADNSYTIVTKDDDFARLAVSGTGPIVLWVRTGNLVNRLLLAHFERAWPEIEVHLASGARLVELR